MPTTNLFFQLVLQLENFSGVCTSLSLSIFQFCCKALTLSLPFSNALINLLLLLVQAGRCSCSLAWHNTEGSEHHGQEISSKLFKYFSTIIGKTCISCSISGGQNSTKTRAVTEQHIENDVTKKRLSYLYMYAASNTCFRAKSVKVKHKALEKWVDIITFSRLTVRSSISLMKRVLLLSRPVILPCMSEIVPSMSWHLAVRRRLHGTVKQ